MDIRFDERRDVAELQVAEAVAVDVARAIADAAVFSAASRSSHSSSMPSTRMSSTRLWGFAGQSVRPQHRGRAPARCALGPCRRTSRCSRSRRHFGFCSEIDLKGASLSMQPRRATRRRCIPSSSESASGKGASSRRRPRQRRLRRCTTPPRSHHPTSPTGPVPVRGHHSDSQLHNRETNSHALLRPGPY
jgi:hypothetical protein